MLTEILWPTETRITIEQIEMETDRLLVTCRGTQTIACCPDCETVSSRTNGSYRRHPADAPCGGYAIELNLMVPRFFCDNEDCSRRTFAGCFSPFVAPYARRTSRLVKQQRRVGLTTSAEEGSRLLPQLGMKASADTLIRLVRNTPEPASTTPKVIGIDDWAKRKGHSYGTILIDLEEHRVIDLLDDRSAESLAQWLQEHPGVEIISRDRGKEFIEGATNGAPDAIQVADRFHLLQNLVDVLKRMFVECPSTLRKAAHQVAEAIQAEASEKKSTISTVEIPPATGHADGMPGTKQTLQKLRFAEVKELQAQGLSRRAVARQLNIDPRTVGKYFLLDACPQRMVGPQSSSTALPFLNYLTKRWHEGCHEITQLHAELETLGYTGHYSSVRRLVKRLLSDGSIPVVKDVARLSVPRLSPTEAAWLLLHPDDRLDEVQIRLRDQLCRISADVQVARELAQSFSTMLRDRTPATLDPWLERARNSGIKAFRNFAASLQGDYAAVKAALIYQWSNGQVEGQVNRLKLVKRRMYGRANFDLLRKQVLGVQLAA